MSPNTFIQGRLVKTEWFVANVTAVGSPDRAKHAILGVILAGRVFGQIQDIFVVAEPLCDVGTSS